MLISTATIRGLTTYLLISSSTRFSLSSHFLVGCRESGSTPYLCCSSSSACSCSSMFFWIIIRLKISKSSAAHTCSEETGYTINYRCYWLLHDYYIFRTLSTYLLKKSMLKRFFGPFPTCVLKLFRCYSNIFHVASKHEVNLKYIHFL